MFRAALFTFVLHCSLVHAESSFFDAKGQKMLDAREYKELIGTLEERIKKSKDPAVYLQLAVVYLRDQQEEKSFSAFFAALENTRVENAAKPSLKEQELFETLRPLYTANNPIALEEKVKEVLRQNPKATYLEFLLASSYANQHKFENFFYSFYPAYKAYSKSYLACKTQGVLSTLLLQRARTPEEKELWRKKALVFFTEAFYEMPEDFGLHKMLILTTHESERPEVVRKVVKTVIEKNIQIARADVPFYVGQSLAIHDVALAQSLLDKAKSWYEYSRILADMQKRIDQETK
jgi:hypothetical protein